MAGPEVGEVAPDFTLPSTQGEVRLSERLARGAVLLVFYPGDETRVCTQQLCDYRDGMVEFAGLGVDVVAINTQGLDSHRRFAEKHALPFPLCADASGEVCRAYGARGLLGMTKRALVLVGPDGRVRWRRTDLPILHRSTAEILDAIEDQDLAAD